MPIQKLSEELLTAIAQEYDDLEALNLSNNRICTVENLHILSSLTKLDLSSNAIEHAGNFEQCAGLQMISLENNVIRTVSPTLADLKQLHTLKLAHNKLTNLEDVVHLLSCIPSLRRVSLKGNPLASLAHYPATVLHTCPFIHVLDEVPVSELRTSVLHGHVQDKGHGNEAGMAAELPEQQADSTVHHEARAMEWNGKQYVQSQYDMTRQRPMSEVIFTDRDPQFDAAAIQLQVNPLFRSGNHQDAPPPQVSTIPGISCEPALKLQPVPSLNQGCILPNPQVQHIKPSEACPPAGVELQSQQASPIRNIDIDAFPPEEPTSQQLAGSMPAAGVPDLMDDSAVLTGGYEHTDHYQQQGSQHWAGRLQEQHQRQQQQRTLEQAMQDAHVLRKKHAEEQRKREAVEAELRSLSANFSSGMRQEPQRQGTGIAEQKIQTDSGTGGRSVRDKFTWSDPLERQVNALREIIAIMEAHIAEDGCQGCSLIERWRQEVFKAIICRRANERALDEVRKIAQEREAMLHEQLKAAKGQAQILQQKTLDCDAEAELAKEDAAAARRELAMARKAEYEREAELKEALGALAELAAKSYIVAESCAETERCLKVAENKILVLARRLLFAEDRLELVKAAVKDRPTTSLVEALQHERNIIQSDKAALLVQLSAMQDTLAAHEHAATELRAEMTKASAERLAKEGEAVEAAAKSVAEAQEKQKVAEERTKEVAEEMRLLRADLETEQVMAAKSKSDLIDCRQRLQEALAALEASVQAERDAEAKGRETLRALDDNHKRNQAAIIKEREEGTRQAAKMAVTVRQLERQIARLQEKSGCLPEDRIKTLEHKLHEKDAAIRAARRERNILLAAQRNVTAINADGIRESVSTLQANYTNDSRHLSPKRHIPKPLPHEVVSPSEVSAYGPRCTPEGVDMLANTIRDASQNSACEAYVPPMKTKDLFSTVVAPLGEPTLNFSPGYVTSSRGTSSDARPQAGTSSSAFACHISTNETALLSRLSDLEVLTESLLDDL